MNKSFAEPKMLASTILVLLLTAAALIPARALADPAALLVSPEGGLSFKQTTVGTQAPTQEVQLLNKGDAASIDKISIDGGDGAFYLEGSFCGYLETGALCPLWIGFAPSAEGEQEAKVEIVFKDEKREPEAFPVRGTGVPPKLGFAPETHDFGLQRVNRDAVSQSFKLVNNGEAGVQPGAYEIVGSGSDAFSTGNSDCNRWLEPGEACTIDVWFNPHEQTSYEAELRAWAAGSLAGAALYGQGGRAVIEAPENPVGFAPATAGSEGEVRTIVLSNSGNLPAGFFIGVIAGGDSGSFELLDENCTAAELQPGASCAAHVRFDPQGVGAKTARLAFFGDGDDGMMVSLQGEGLAAAAALLPDSHDFGAGAVGHKSAPQTFVVSNDGSGSLDLDRVEIVGADLDQFTLSGDGCSGTVLGSGERCEIRVRFAPDGAGAKSAKLRVRGAGGSLASALAGEGEEATAEKPEPPFDGYPGGEPPAGKPAKPAAGPGPVTVVTETHVIHTRQKRRFARNHGLRGTRAQALRRHELRAGRARR